MVAFTAWGGGGGGGGGGRVHSFMYSFFDHVKGQHGDGKIDRRNTETEEYLRNT